MQRTGSSHIRHFGPAAAVVFGAPIRERIEGAGVVLSAVATPVNLDEVEGVLRYAIPT